MDACRGAKPFAIIVPLFCQEIAAAEQQACQQQGGAQAGVEYGDEHFRYQIADPQDNASGHHDGHNGEGFPVKEFQKEQGLVWIAQNAGGVLFYQLSKDKGLKQEKNQSR